MFADAAFARGLGVSAVEGVEDPLSAAPLRTVGWGQERYGGRRTAAVYSLAWSVNNQQLIL